VAIFDAPESRAWGGEGWPPFQEALQPLSGVAVAQRGAQEPKHGHGALLVSRFHVGVSPVSRGERLLLPRQGTAALTAAQRAHADGERFAARRVVYEASAFHGTNDKIASTTAHSP
jgi:hypothetical protein